MALTNAERQERFRQRRKEKGLVRKETWADRDGFIGPTSASGERPRISRNKYTRDLNKLMESMNEAAAEEIYAELLAVAKQLKAKYDITSAAADKSPELKAANEAVS